MPVLDFKTTPKVSRTKRDNVLVVEINASLGQIEDDLTKLHEEVIFEGRYLKTCHNAVADVFLGMNCTTLETCIF